MQIPRNRPLRPHSTAALGLMLIAMAAIFVTDTVTDYAIAAAVFYTAVILVATQLLPPRTVVALAGACIVLTLLSFALTHSGAYEVGLVNTGISILAIGISTSLSLRLVAAEAAAHEARESLLRLARVTSLGELTASIAHEVNQPLAAIVTSAGACKRWLAQEPPGLDNAERAINRIIDEANRASAVIGRVRGFASGRAPQRSRFDFNDMALEILALARSQIDRHDITLVLDLRDRLPAVMADRVQIGQVVGNLLLNAIEAIAAADGTNRRLAVASAIESPHSIRFSVADSGIGLPAQDMDRLFDAFWTTKADGIGLGLTICRSIVESAGGRIWAEPNPGGGAVFLFTLPIARGEDP